MQTKEITIKQLNLPYKIDLVGTEFIVKKLVNIGKHQEYIYFCSCESENVAEYIVSALLKYRQPISSNK